MQGGSPTVLIVDDHEDSVEMYSLGLLGMGLSPVTAATAADAFRCACEHRPNVIVVDVSLRDSSGLELTERLRGDARTHDAGIIVLTGHTDGTVQQQAYDAGCDRFLLKPCLPDVLAGEIHDVLVARSGIAARGLDGR